VYKKLIYMYTMISTQFFSLLQARAFI